MASNDKVAIITGAGTGIGKRSALALLRDGWSVALAGRRVEKLEETMDEAGELARNTLVVRADVGDHGEVKELFSKTREAFGRLDLLFNNAGTGSPARPLEDLTFEVWRRVVDANLTGPFLCTQEAFKIMKEQTPMGGRIINNGSISAQTPEAQLGSLHGDEARIGGLDEVHRAGRAEV